jgi:eukaryotic-like serine/threonine-protein kinase
MENGRAKELHPASLPMGTRVGAWKVVGWRGRGAYGAVYRAVGQEQAGPVALKLAVHPEDPRFEREATLLSRLEHPNVPRLHGHGVWRQGERAYPYLVMQWVEGTPLYDWAAARNPTSRQLLEMVAQLAGALAAIHALGAVHRDVKGDNVVVGSDGQVFLMDLGSCTWPGVSPLTAEPLPPGTMTYRSPEAWRFAHEHARQRGAHYEAQAADDVFALGLTAYRLVTDEYPPTTDPSKEESRIWHVEGRGPRPPAELNPRLNPWLSALILRMLSVPPERRGGALELAGMLEQEAEQADGESDLPAFAWETLAPAAWPREEAAAAADLGHRPRHRIRDRVYAAEARDSAVRAEAARVEAEELARAVARMGDERPLSPVLLKWLPLLAAAGAGFVLAGLVERRGEDFSPAEGVAVMQREGWDGGVPDGGTAELAREALAARVEDMGIPKEARGVSVEMPKSPLPGQRRPNGSGKCPGRGEVAIHGGCWILGWNTAPPCAEGWFEWEGACYYPVTEASRKPTSDQP